MADFKSESQLSEEEDQHTRQKLEELRRAQEEAERQAQMHKKLAERPDDAPPPRDGQLEAEGAEIHSEATASLYEEAGSAPSSATPAPNISPSSRASSSSAASGETTSAPLGNAPKTDPTANSPSASSIESTYSASLSIHIARDNWTTDDSLGLKGYAYAIAAFLTHEKSRPPLTISIQAPWGGGKTSLMRMVQRELDKTANELAERDRAGEPRAADQPAGKKKAKKAEEEKPGEGPGLTVADLSKEVEARLRNEEEALPRVDLSDAKTNRVTVWFNAWKYESMNQIWAGLVDAILQQVPSRFSRAKQEKFWLQLNLSRVNSAAIRQRLHNYFIHRLLRTTAGLAWAFPAAAVSAFVVLVLEPSSVGLVEKASNAIGQPGLSATIFVIVLAVIKAVAVHFKVKSEPVSEVLNDLVEVPKYDNELGFVHQVEKDLRRVFDCLPKGTSLVIFIDDLDRCTPPKVAAVLEAINLFLAGDFRECSFVFGMDSEMVAAALQSAHKDLAAALPSDAKVPIGWRFMDKFVQLPFVIPPVNADTQKEFVCGLLGKSTSQQTASEKPESAGAAKSKEEDWSSSSPSAEAPPSMSSPKMTSEQFREAVERAGAFDDDNPEYQGLVLEAMPLFKGNPRELKIFLNLFRFNQLIWYARNQNENSVPSKQALCRWTAMSVKWPEHVRWLKRAEPRPIVSQKRTTDMIENEKTVVPRSSFEVLEVLARTCYELSARPGNLAG